MHDMSLKMLRETSFLPGSNAWKKMRISPSTYESYMWLGLQGLRLSEHDLTLGWAHS